jgi:transposase
MSAKKPSTKQHGSRRRFSAAFKADVVRLCREGQESLTRLSERLNLPESTVRAWLRQAAVDAVGGTVDTLSSAERLELDRLRRETKRLQDERDILREAVAFFARDGS